MFKDKAEGMAKSPVINLKVAEKNWILDLKFLMQNRISRFPPGLPILEPSLSGASSCLDCFARWIHASDPYPRPVAWIVTETGKAATTPSSMGLTESRPEPPPTSPLQALVRRAWALSNKASRNTEPNNNDIDDACSVCVCVPPTAWAGDTAVGGVRSTSPSARPPRLWLCCAASSY